jgi:alpha-D-ribose 1-methylphosphonate 5-triphosphate diphosphatase
MHELGAAMSEFPIDLASAHAAREMGLHVIMGAPNAMRGVSSTVGNLSAQDGIAAGVVDVLASDYYPAAMLQAPFALARRGVLSLHDAVNLVSRNPALAAGLADRGEISAGKQADLAIVEEGDPVRVRATMRAGRWVYNDGACPALSHAEEEAPATVSAVE